MKTLASNLVFGLYHLRGSSGLSEREVDMRNIKREVRGENQGLDDYRHLPPWQWTSVAQRQEWSHEDSNYLNASSVEGGSSE